MPDLSHTLRALALAGALLLVSAYGTRPAAQPETIERIRDIAPQKIQVGPEIAAFYQARDFAPVWLDGNRLSQEARTLVSLLPEDPLLNSALQAVDQGGVNALTRADLLLTRAYLEQAQEVQSSALRGSMHFVDAELAPEPAEPGALLQRLGSDPLASAISRSLSLNPVHEGLIRGLAIYRQRWSTLPVRPVQSIKDVEGLSIRLGVQNGSATSISDRLTLFQRDHGLEVTGRADPETLAALNRGPSHYEQLIQDNIDRARQVRPHHRYLLVDSASAQAWMIEGGRIAGTMRVVVGRASMKTPIMAGLIRHVVLNPYWNLPPDLIRQRARKAVRHGPAVITGERIEVLSDWSDEARRLDPRQVNWAAVASGRRDVNLRQLPGPSNMMGAIKFMLPNDLGIYLHDTPFKADFRRSDRRLSSGCVRVEDPDRLARWLFGGNSPAASGDHEQEVDLPEPVPVYIAYFTALPGKWGIRFQPDPYRMDRVRSASAHSHEARARF